MIVGINCKDVSGLFFSKSVVFCSQEKDLVIICVISNRQKISFSIETVKYHVSKT